MPISLYIQRRGHTLIPASGPEALDLEKLPEGRLLRCDVVQPRPRNGGFHRLSWALFGQIAEALNHGPHTAPWTAEDVKDNLLVATGHCREVTVRGKTGFVPKHTNFGAMDQQEYGRFVDAAMIYVRDDLCRWIEDAPNWPDIAEILKASHLMEDAE